MDRFARIARSGTRIACGAGLALFAVGCAPEELTGQSTEALTVCAHGATIEGVDVSEWQGGGIDWNAVHASGRQFAIARISYGSSHLDPTFARNWTAIRAAGMIRGAYQWFRPQEDPAAQADIVIRAVGRLGADDMPVMADIEETGTGVPQSTYVARLHTWLDRVEAGTGKRPFIYTAGWYWNPNVGSTAFGSYGLSVAAYGPACPTMPLGWTDWKVFQYCDGDPRNCSVGPVPGIGQSCDRDRFNGTLEDLRAWIGGGAAWGGQFVMQSFPYAAAGTVQIHAGESADVWIEMRNIGTHAWDGHTLLGTTMARDRSSHFAGPEWPGPDRPAAVHGTVAPGATYRFAFTLHAPADLAPGRYDEHWGMVEEGTAWFSDPGQAGPPDNQLEGIVEVLPARQHPDDASADGSTDDAASDDATPPADASTPDAGASDASRGDAHPDGSAHDELGGGMHGGCACRAAPASGAGVRAVIGLAAAAAACAGGVRRRRRRAARGTFRRDG